MTRSNPALRWVLSLLAGIVIAVVAVVVRNGVHHNKANPPPLWGGCADSAAPVSASLSSPVSAPGGGGLVVSEQGFSPVMKGQRVSVGAVVKNTGTTAAYRTRVTFSAFNAHGSDVVGTLPVVDRIYYHVEIPLILPGQEVGVGTTANSIMPSDVYNPPKIVRVGVTLVSTHWVAVERGTALFHPLAGTVTGGSQDGSDVVRFAMSDGGCENLFSRGAGVVFRNSSGTIIGGTIGNPSRDLCYAPDGGESIFGGNDVPAGIDAGRSLVSPYCDIARQGADTRN